MRDAARAELEVEYIKKVEDSIKKGRRESRNQDVSEEEMSQALSSLQLMTDQQLKEATTTGKESRLFRTIVGMDATRDDNKATYEVYQDIWRHT